MNVEKYIEDGYIIVEPDLIDSDIDLINSEVDRCLTIEDKKTQSNYQYTEFPRLFEAWKQSKPIYNLCKNKNIIDAIELLYGEKCFPFSTINFTGPSNQPLHSDTIHFNTIPQNRMCGVWVALEDTNADNGTLSIVPGSHLWSTHDYQSIGLPHPDTIVDGEKENYRKYEEFIISLVKENNAQAVPICLKKGQALIWEANLLLLNSRSQEKYKQFITFSRIAKHIIIQCFRILKKRIMPTSGVMMEKEWRTIYEHHI